MGEGRSGDQVAELRTHAGRRALQAPDALLPMGAVVRLTGLTARAIRHYEDHALVQPLRNRRGGRLFDAAGVRRLQFVGQARRAGLSLDQVNALLAAGDSQGEAARASKALGLFRARLEELDRQRRAVEQGMAALAAVQPARLAS